MSINKRLSNRFVFKMLLTIAIRRLEVVQMNKWKKSEQKWTWVIYFMRIIWFINNMTERTRAKKIKVV